MNKDLQNQSHKRLNILTGEWLLVSPHRNLRPWQGQETEQVIQKKESYLTDCYLCPGNTRSNGKVNPEYESTFLFENDFLLYFLMGKIFQYKRDFYRQKVKKEFVRCSVFLLITH